MAAKTKLSRTDPHLALLGRLTRIFHSSLDPRVILQTVLVDVAEMVKATSGSIMLINPEKQVLEIEASTGLTAQAARLQLKIGEGITGWVAAHGRPLRTGNVHTQPQYVAIRQDILSELAVPLIVRHRSGHGQRKTSETIIGVLNVDSVRPSAFSTRDGELLAAVAGQIGNLLQNVWLYDQARRRADQLDLLLRLSRGIMAGQTLDETLQRTTTDACALFDAQICAVFLLDESGGNLHWRASSSAMPSSPRRHPLPVDDSQLGIVIHQRKPVALTGLPGKDPLLAGLLPKRKTPQSMVAAPLIAKDKPIGALVFFLSAAHRFSNEEINVASTLANLLALGIQRCQYSEKLVSTEELLRQNERLSAIGLLAAEVAHEIRTPLTVIKMLIQGMAAEIPPHDPRARDFDVLTRKMNQMGATVNRILGLARNAEPVFEAVSLNTVVQDLLLLLRPKLASQKIRLILQLAEPPPHALADRMQIEQVLLNITLNSLHAMSDEGVLTIRTFSRKGTVALAVKDSGSGIPLARQKDILLPFLTLRREGSGLGMAIVKRIVESHQGRLEIRSRPRQGTTVKVTLPEFTRSSP
ncbi:MAG: GAF domain-containing protein [Verrucomicrobiae bacterium]|nr:GAF domain-containing protein [Verrucomicrobiae bacterium]